MRVAAAVILDRDKTKVREAIMADTEDQEEGIMYVSPQIQMPDSISYPWIYNTVRLRN